MAIEKLYEGNIRKKYILYALPLILSSMLSQSYDIINSVMIGKFIGSTAFAAISATAPFIEFIDSIFWGYLTGISIYAASLFGRSEYEKMLNVLKINFIISTLIAIILSSSCLIRHRQLFDLLNISDEIWKDAFGYFSVRMSGLIIFQFVWGFLFLSHGLGLTTMPLLVSTVSGIINMVGNYLFLVVMGKGIEFCAISSIISNSIALTIYLIKFMGVFRSMNLRMRGIKFNKEELKTSIGYSIPNMLQQIVMSSSGALVSPLTNTCSTAAISGLNIANKAKSIEMAIYQGSNKANTNFVAQAMGAGKIDKIREGIKTGITQTLSLFLPVMFLFAIFANGFSAAFLDKTKDAESIHYAVTLIRFFVPFLTFNLFNNLFHGIFRAIGSGKIMLTSTFIYTIAMLVFCYTFYHTFPAEYRIYGIYSGFVCAWITESIFATIVFISGKWKTKAYRELESKINS